MSDVRVLAGTHKGLFIMTSDGKRRALESGWPLLCRLGHLSRERFARGSGSASMRHKPVLGSARDPALK